MSILRGLDFYPVNDNGSDLIANPVKKFIEENNLSDIEVAEIDADFSDTAAFCKKYQIELSNAANCVIVEAKRADKVWHGACVIMATNRADINGVVRKTLDARKISFASMEKATKLSGMEYGAITPLGLPESWPILVDVDVVENDQNIIGSGKRNSKLIINGNEFRCFPNVKILDIKK